MVRTITVIWSDLVYSISVTHEAPPSTPKKKGLGVVSFRTQSRFYPILPQSSIETKNDRLITTPMPPPTTILLALLAAMSLANYAKATAPSTLNTVDEPDAQRLPLTRLQCGCRFTKNRIKAVPLVVPQVAASSTFAGSNLLLLNLQQQKQQKHQLQQQLIAQRKIQVQRTQQQQDPPSVSAKAPDKLECGCHTIKVTVRPKAVPVPVVL
jgi:hypothetical protein